jgi:membrane protease YdiL (CAAX protease family)
MGLDRFESEIALFAAVVVILLGEWLLIQRQFLSGIFLYSVILLLLLLYATYRWEHEQRYLVVLAIPSIIRLLNFTLPLGDLSPLFAQAVIALPLTLSGMVFVWLFNRPGFLLIFKWRLTPTYLLLVGLGSIVGLVLFQFKQPARLTWNTPLLLFFYLFVLVVAMAFLEEWLFRGIMQTVLSNLLGKNFAGFVVALVYTILHINQGTWIFVLLMFVFALGLGWLRNKSESLTQVFLVHGAANLVFFLILPRI